jgi:hypothetical protein
MAEAEKKIKILYIVGTGRNGSTLLDTVLGNSDKIHSTGEVFNTFSAWRANKICSCGKAVDKCLFWSQVKELFDKSFKQSDYSILSKIEKHFERAPLSPLNLIFHKIVSSQKYRLYTKFLKEFYTAIYRVSRKPVLADSSKNPLRGYALLNIFKEDIYFIHLVRDGRGQMWSWMKTGIIPPFGISIRKNNKSEKKTKDQYYWWTPWLYAISWLIYSLLSSAVIWKAGSTKSLQIKYEDFLKDPSHHVGRISNLIAEDLSDVDKLIMRNEPFRIDHIVAGNRLRLLKEVTLRPPDEGWRAKLPAGYKKSFWLVAGWLSKLYGYQYTK